MLEGALIDADRPPPDFRALSQVERNAWASAGAACYRQRQEADAHHREELRRVRERMGLNEQSARKPNGAGERQAEAPAVDLPVVFVAELAGKAAPPRSWYVPDWIPDRQVTQFGGDGETGKSTVALQLAVASAADLPWFGLKPAAGPVVVLSAEDDGDELHRRVEAIAASYSVALSDLKHPIALIPLADQDVVLAGPTKPGVIVATAVFRGFEAIVERVKPRLVILDVLADLFSGDETKRSEARQFIALLRGLAIRHKLAVLLLAHPSLAGLSSGSGTSGSTGWSNSVRSRIYLERIKANGDDELDGDVRFLTCKKSNYGARPPALRLRWREGCFALDGHAESFDKIVDEARCEAVFVNLAADLIGQGRDLSPNRSPTFAPSLFAKHPSAKGLSKEQFEKAIERLLSAGRIRVETVGPPSRKYKRLVFVRPKEEP
jgi:RecA-family ATPase